MRTQLTICAFALVAAMGCISSPKAASIRRQLADSAINDLNNAHDEIMAVAQADLAREAKRALDDLDAQTLKTAAELDMTDPQNALALATKYAQERERLRGELAARARGFALIMAKTRLGAQTVDTLEKMQTEREDIESKLLRDFVTEDLPKALTGLGINLSPEAAGQVTSLLGGVSPSAPAKPLGPNTPAQPNPAPRSEVNQ